ncbi:MAG TPA: N-acyl-D-glucosamine 2-epimerase [Bacteroidales bacterium]|nr:N-acyl-D-glucosamine 2-epimerase [Bacteroidales bacterium]
MTADKTIQLLEELTTELKSNILPFWMNHAIDSKGGFFGQINCENNSFDAPRGGVLNARILWTFSAAFNRHQNAEYLETANHAYNYLIKHFIDNEFGGIYWKLDSEGKPIETKKQIYALAFGMYALVEYYLASDVSESLLLALELHQLIEKHSFDNEKNGYFEAFSKEWNKLDDLRLSDKDENVAKTLNTHLHILEAYTRLHSTYKDTALNKQLENLVEIHLEKMLDWETGHFRLFFDVDWNLKSELISFGHDIEAAWLIYEAAKETENLNLIEKSIKALKIIADATIYSGLAADGSLYYEKTLEHTDKDRHWWAQAEAMTGFWYAYQITNDKIYLEKVFKLWEFIKNHIIATNGEWYWSVNDKMEVNTMEGKAGFWKCPYHNSRTMLILTKSISNN